MAQFEHIVQHINDPFLSNENSKDSQLRLINHEFQKREKQMMIFTIEEVSYEQSIQSYQSSCIFDELLEFYAYLNVWAVEENEQKDDQVEKFYYKHDSAVELSDELYEKA